MRSVLLVLLVLAAPLAFAQKRAPLDTALRDVAAVQGVSVLYTADLVADRTTTCPAERRRDPAQDLDAVLVCVLDGTGLEALRLPSGAYALRPAGAPATAASIASTVTLSGIVTDAQTGEAVIGATVYVPDLRRGAATNLYGFYSLTLPAGALRVEFSYVGYAKQAQAVGLVAARRLDVALAPAPETIGEIIVEAEATRRPETATQMSVDVMTGQDIRQVPALLGEADLLKALQLLPGVRGGTEASTGLHVRGGSPDQNLILLDGTPVYNASHLFGFLSVFNPDAVNRVEITRGGFPARYGGRLSSVVDIRLREGNFQRHGAQGAVGLLTSKLLLEGPIVRERGSFLVSGRRTYLDLAIRPFLSSETERPTAYFYDLNAKANWRISSRDRVFLSLYGGGDRFGMTEQWQHGAVTREASGHVGWGNLTGALRWSRVFSGRLFGAATLVASDYLLSVDASERERSGRNPWTRSEARYHSGIRDLGVRVDFDFAAHPHHMVRFGGDVRRHRYETGAIMLRNPEMHVRLGARPVQAVEASAYLEDEMHLTERLFANVGVHASAYSAGGRTFGSVQPRLAARFQLADELALKASAVTMRQYVHLLTTASGLGLPTDLWVPATPRVRPGDAYQLAAGMAGSAFESTTWTLEVYYKQMSGQVAYRDGASFATPGTDWQDLVVSGDGRSFGMELGIDHRTDGTTLSLAYTLARAERRFEDVSEGRWYPYRYDRRHDLAIAAIRRLSNRFDISATWVYGTGDAVTVPLATYPAISATHDFFGFLDEVPYYGDRRNAFRLPAYHRLDLDLSYYFRRRPREHRLSLSAYNAYNRKNPFIVMLDERSSHGPMPSPQPGAPEQGAVLRGYAVFPVVPSLSYSFQF